MPTTTTTTAHQLVLTERIPLPQNSSNNNDIDEDDDDSEEEATTSQALLITLNRPKKKNCFNTQLCCELATVLYNVANEIEEYDHVTKASVAASATISSERRRKKKKIVTVLLTGAGQSFCAGADLTDPPNPIHQSSDLSHHLRYNPVYQMSRIGVPIIGVLRGHVITGGFELALACDILLGDSTTIFRDTHVKFGLAPCWGLSQNLRRRIGPGRAKLISFTAHPVLADRAYEWGLLDELVTVPPSSPSPLIVGVGSSSSKSDESGKVPTTTTTTTATTRQPDPVLYRAIELSEAIARNNPLMIRRYKRAIVEGANVNYSNGLQRERELGLAHYLEIVGDGRTFESAKEYFADHHHHQEQQDQADGQRPTPQAVTILSQSKL